jgi:hypothetical protein
LKRKRIILVSILLILLVALLVYVEQRRSSQEPLDVWALVPESAALVYETSSLPANWESLHTSNLWNILQNVENFRTLEARMQLLDSLINLGAYFSSKQLLVGTHVVAKDAFDFSFFFRMDDASEYNAALRALKRFEEQPNIRTDSRMFNGFQISELVDQQSGLQFSYLIHQNIFAGSFTPFLIEDVVRNIETGFDSLGFQYHNVQLTDFPKLADDEGNLYLNSAKIPLLLSVFTSNEVLPQLQPLADLSKTLFMDVNLTANQLLLNGFSKFPKEADAYWLSTFDEEQPQSIEMYGYVPERTAMLYHVGINNGSDWLDRLYQQQSKSDDKLVKQTVRYREHLQQYYQIAPRELVSWLGKEIGLLVLESIDVENPDKVMILQAEDTAVARQQLMQVETKLKQDEGIPGYQESFAGYRISEISYKEYPATILGPMALGFEQCFYLITERYVIFANSIRALKRLIADREAENTWDKSIREVRFLDTSLDQSNVSLFINTARSWRMLLSKLNPEWRSFANKHEAFIKSYDHLAVQFSHTEDDYYTSVALSYRPAEAGDRERNQFRDVSRLFVDHTLRTKPFVVKDHTNQTLEVVFQDEASHMYLSELNGDLQWKDSLGAAIISEVYQIDYYKNGKLQYLFATDSAIHVIDRNGDYISGYPSYLPEGVRVRHFSLIDYDNSKNYRFMVADEEGRLWMFNQERENLEGWNPNNSLSAPLATPLFHVRVRNRDFMIAIQEDGEIYALNRRGQPYAGFPIKLSKTIQSPAYVDLGSTPGNTQITTVSTMGEVIAFNLEGNITLREQLYRPSAETRFQLSLDALGKTFVIVRQDEQIFGVLDYRGKLLFEKNFLSPAALARGQLEVQYYNFGAGNELFAVTDQVQEFTYLFSAQGTLIKDRPIESSYPVGILFYENENRYQVFRNFDNEFSVLSFSL